MVVAILAGVLTIAFVSVVEGRRGFALNAQEKASTTEVKIDNFSFGPPTLTVPVGTVVTWTNRDDIPHTVVSTDESKTSSSLKCSIQTVVTIAGCFFIVSRL